MHTYSRPPLQLDLQTSPPRTGSFPPSRQSHHVYPEDNRVEHRHKLYFYCRNIFLNYFFGFESTREECVFFSHRMSAWMLPPMPHRPTDRTNHEEWGGMAVQFPFTQLTHGFGWRGGCLIGCLQHCFLGGYTG